MPTHSRIASLSLAIGAVLLLAGGAQSQAAIIFPANQTPFNAVVGDGTTIHDVCAFVDNVHKQKNFFTADVDWEDDGIFDSLDVTVAKVGRRNFVVRAAHNYASCQVANVRCRVKFDKGLQHDLPIEDTNQAIIASSVAPPPAITLSEGCPASGAAMTATTPAVLGATYVWAVRDGSGADIPFAGDNTTQVSFTAPANGTRLQVLLAEAVGGCPVGPSNVVFGQIDFADVASGHPQHEDICAAGAGGFTAGCGAGNFCPDDPITRQTLALVGTLIRHRNDVPSYDVPEGTGVNSDVGVNDDFVDWVEAAIADGWMAACDGVGPRFCPTDPASRAQLARFGILSRDGLPAPADPLVNPFDDVIVGDFADEYIDQMKTEFAAIPVPLGCGTNLFCPTSAATRAHAAHFLVNIFGVPVP